MSLILGIDTSSTELGIGLIKDGKPFLSFSRYVRNSHAEQITQAINFVLKSSKIVPSDITHAGISCGPGSFTGLRIGISFVKGFFFDSTIPILPISSLQSMATSFNKSNGTIVAAMDARKSMVFYGKFRKKKEICERIDDDILAPVEQFLKIYDKDSIFIIDTLGYLKSTVFKSLEEKPNVYSVDKTPLQRGLACAQLAFNAKDNDSLWTTSINILPNYMQAPYGENKTTCLGKLK